MGPLLALGLQSFMRDSSAFPPGLRGTPTSFSSSSSTDGDVDFQSPEGSQGRRPGKGVLAGLRLGVDPGKGGRRPSPLSCPTCPSPAASPSVRSIAGETWGGSVFRWICFSYLAQKGQGSIEDLLKIKGVSLSIQFFFIPATKR